MSSIDQMLARWREEEVAVNPGATTMQIESLERLLGGLLPPDLRSFYSTMNGMNDYQHDARMVSMWAIERIVRERNVHEGEDEWGTYQDIAFADVIFSAWHLRFRVRPEGRTSILAELTHEELPSLYVLFEAMLQRPASLGLAAPSPPRA